MQQITTENLFYATSSAAIPFFNTDAPIEEWRSTRLDLMLMFNNEFNEDYEEAKAFLKGQTEDFNVEKDIGFIDEYPLSIDYIEPNISDTPPHWRYLIAYGGPGSEIRFFVDDKSSTKPYKVEFWYLEWSNSRKQDLTGEIVIEQLWEQTLLPLTEHIATQNEESSRETQEIDSLLALMGTLENDVRKIKRHIKDSVHLDEISLEHKAGAERKARETFVLELLRQGDISAGRAARLLNISRWDLSELMYVSGISPFDDSLTAEILDAEVKSALKDFDKSKS